MFNPKECAMNYKTESMLRATDAASTLALLREFIEEARNVKAHLDRIAKSCEKDQAKQAA